jgi:hypothetical protein
MHHAHDATLRVAVHRLEAYSSKCLEDKFLRTSPVANSRNFPCSAFSEIRIAAVLDALDRGEGLYWMHRHVLIKLAEQLILVSTFQ